MRTINISIILVVLLATGFSALGQTMDPNEDENWIKDFRGIYSGNYRTIRYRYDNYTKADIPIAKQKLAEIKTLSPTNEWEGIYYANTAIGDNMMIWNAKSGFFSFYHYHEFRRLDYGKIKNTEDSIKFDSEKPPNSKVQAKTFYERHIKIKFGERHFLVPESRIKDFVKIMAGLEGTSTDFYFYWTKNDDMDKDGFGVPIVPEKYKHLLRYPIKATIIDIGERKVIPNSQSTKRYNFDDIHYFVTLNAGEDKNIEIGMDFFVEDLNQWIRIKEVFAKTAIGYFSRSFDYEEKDKERCRDDKDGSGQYTPCKEIRIGMKTTTKSSL